VNEQREFASSALNSTYFSIRVIGRVHSISACSQLPHGWPYSCTLHLTFLALHVMHAYDALLRFCCIVGSSSTGSGERYVLVCTKLVRTLYCWLSMMMQRLILSKNGQKTRVDLLRLNWQIRKYAQVCVCVWCLCYSRL